MAFDDYEKSAYGAQPIEIYTINRDDTEYWRYTSANEDVTVAGNVYTAIPIKRNEIELSQDVERTALKITMPADDDFPEMFIASPPTDRFLVEVRRFHYGDTDVRFLWFGRVINVEHEEHEAILTCESSVASLKRSTLRRVYQIPCPHVLYDEAVGGCTLAKSTFAVPATADAGSTGVTIVSSTFSGYADGYFSGGLVELTLVGRTNRAFVTNHVGDTITTGLPLQGLYVGGTIIAYPGCDHTTTTCRTKFNNLLNFGGFPFMPVKNPMNGTSVF